MSDLRAGFIAAAGWVRVCSKLWVGLICLIPAACGYHLVGEGPLPGGINRLAITVLENRTAHSYLQGIVTNALLDEFSRRRPDMVVDVGQAQAVLGGTIQSLEAQTETREDSQTASQRRVVIHVSLHLTDKAGRILWQEADLWADQVYAVSKNKETSNQNRRQAMETAALRLAENIFERLTSSF